MIAIIQTTSLIRQPKQLSIPSKKKLANTPSIRSIHPPALIKQSATMIPNIINTVCITIPY